MDTGGTTRYVAVNRPALDPSQSTGLTGGTREFVDQGSSGEIGFWLRLGLGLLLDAANAPDEDLG